MKKTLGKIFKTLVVLCLIGALGYAGWQYLEGRREDEAEQEPVYSRVSVSEGTLSQQVRATGSLSLAEAVEIKAPAAVRIAQSALLAGDAVAQGEKLLGFDSEALDERLGEIRQELAALDSELLSLAARQKDTASISAGASGRVKAVYAGEGDSVESVMREHGALALLSLDGSMKVTVPAPEGALVGGEYALRSDGAGYTGTVVKIEDGKMTLSFDDAKVLPGDSVQVLADDEAIGEGLAEVSRPYLVTAYQGGVVDSAPARLNQAVTRASRLFELSHVGPGEDYLSKLREREDKREELLDAQALAADPAVYAPQAAILSAPPAEEGAELEKDSPLVSLLALGGYEMNVTVDELDISKLQTGQRAALVMDALPGIEWEAQVSRISQLGESSGGITGYQVTLSLSGDERLKSGMNGTATIVTKEEKDALLLPLSALQSDRQGSYVWLYREGYEATAEAPGIKTYVETGLSDADFAVISSGLQSGDEVLVVRTALGGQTPGMGFAMPDGGMRMPGGGLRQRQDAGEGGRP